MDHVVDPAVDPRTNPINGSHDRSNNGSNDRSNNGSNDVANPNVQNQNAKSRIKVKSDDFTLISFDFT